MAPDPMRDDMDMMAAEYALRLLEGAELAEAERRFADDAAFRASVEAWEVRLAEFADEVPSEVPDGAVKRALMARLFPETAQEPFWARIGFWRLASLASLLLALGLAVALFNASPSEQGPLYTAQIVAAEGDFRVVAVVDKATDEVFLTRTQGAAPEGRILQVWAHGPDEPAMSVGLWPEGESVRLDLPPEIAAVRGTLTLGVSEEPPGGSTTGSPSGRVFGTVDIPDFAVDL